LLDRDTTVDHAMKHDVVHDTLQIMDRSVERNNTWEEELITKAWHPDVWTLKNKKKETN